jgi:catechol 2,3-dioxygenase-like lactoylglutathione lyase family enzyme
MPHLDRRDFLKSMPLLAATPLAPSRVEGRLFRQASGGPLIPVRALNHMTLSVSDPKRSLDFYQGLFGMPVQARQGPTTLLRIGAGPQFLAISGTGANAAPSINHFCLTTDNFDADRALAALAKVGVTRAEGPGGGLSGGPMKARVRMRGPESGGAPAGTPELYFGDPDGIVVQLQDTRYCGGSGVLGNTCGSPEPSPKKGLLAVRDLSHFTITATDAARSNKFYQDLFGLEVQARQGPSAPLLGVGTGVQFLMFTGGAGAGRAGAPAAPPRPASINHVCMNMDTFKPEDILKTLEGYGIKPRGNTQGPAGPMVSYVSMRMENRGGAKEGTPELYFTDPDGLLIQLQDAKYCGGSGYLGDLCP